MSMAAKDFLFDLHFRDFFRYIMFMLSASSFSLIYDYMSYSCIITGKECKIKFMETYAGFRKNTLTSMALPNCSCSLRSCSASAML